MPFIILSAMRRSLASRAGDASSRPIDRCRRDLADLPAGRGRGRQLCLCRRDIAERLQCRVDKLSLLTDKVDMYDVHYLFRVWYYKNDRLIRILEDTADSSSREQVTLTPQGLS